MSDERRTIVREGLQRTVPFTVERAVTEPDAEGSDGLSLEGHAAVFNTPTLIDSFEGRFHEQVARGAFRKSLADRLPVLQFDHGHHPLIGSIPIGRLRSAKEDQTGLFVRARLANNWLIQPVRDAIADESITGMSFRFSVVRDEWRDADGNPVTDPNELLQMMWGGGTPPTRTLREVKVPELGPVVFPAYAETDVGVRSGQTVLDLGRLRHDPAARTRLARTLWMAEQGNPGDDDIGDGTGAGDTHTDDLDAGTRADTPPAYAPITIELRIDGSQSARDVAERIADAIGSATRGTSVTMHNGTTHTPLDLGSAAGDGTDTDPEQPDADDASRSDPDPAPAADGHADPAPAEERHADDDEPPGGHSSPAPTWASDPRARKAHLAYVREMSKTAADRRAVYEPTVTRWEAEQLAHREPPTDGDPGDTQTTPNDERTTG